jgi:hypothetical protein
MLDRNRGTIANSQPPPIRDPSLRQVVRPIMEQVATLTEGAEVGQPIVRWIAVEMRRREYDASHPELCGLDEIWPWRNAALAISPRHRLLIEPSSVRQTTDADEMRSPTALAPTSGAISLMRQNSACR